MYNPSTATFACHSPSRRTSRSIHDAGSTSASDTGTTTTSSSDSRSVILGLMTRK